MLRALAVERQRIQPTIRPALLPGLPEAPPEVLQDVCATTRHNNGHSRPLQDDSRYCRGKVGLCGG